MRGAAVRKILQREYEEDHKEVVEAVSKLLNSDHCGLFHKLTPYQVQILYDKGRTTSFADGEVLIKESATDCQTLNVLLKGSVSIRLGGKEIARRGPNDVVGDCAALFGEALFEAVAVDGPVQALSLERYLLVDMFGDKLQQALLKSRSFAVLQQYESFSKEGVDFLDTVYGLAKIFELSAGEEVEQTRASFAICVGGSVQADALASNSLNKTPVPEACKLCGKAGDAIGLINLKEGGMWTLKAKALDDAPATIVVWTGEGLSGMLRRRMRKSTAESNRSSESANSNSLDVKRHHTVDLQRSRSDLQRSSSMKLACASGDKFGALKKVIVLRTLTTEQLAMLAASMQVSFVSKGEDIFCQGDCGHEFIIIHSGHVEIKVNGKRVRTLGMGDYIGERALLFDEPRSATVTATEDSELWKMGKDVFDQVVKGPIRDYMKDRISFQNTRIDLDDLDCVRIVGRGGFGLVKMVRQKGGKGGSTRYALKCVSKRHAIEHQQAEALVVERSIMAELDHPFVYKFIRSYSGPSYVYFLTELVTGGELIDVLDVLGCLKRPQAQFYLGSIALALEFLHERRIAYLDLKGENCLIDQHGYLKMIDFGIAERVKSGRLHVVKGTPLFMAPEVILGKGYTTSADLWSLGVCLYDFMLGSFPFGSDTASQTEIFRAVLRQPLKFPKTPKTEECSKSLMQALLNKEPEKRPGAGPEGYVALKDHDFFAGFNWDGLVARQLKPPFVPKKETYAEDSEEQQAGKIDVEATCAKCHDDVQSPDFVDPNPSLWEDF